VTVQVHIPPVLRSVTGGNRNLEAEGSTIAEVLRDLARNYPPLALHLFDENGSARRNVLCIHGMRAVRPRDFDSHAVNPGDEIILTNALAGG
jgi:molybdopterin converting factor small subunit